MTTQEDIQDRINERLTIDANLLEGGFSQDIIGSVAYELANIYDVQLPDILANGFVSTADREHLIEKGVEYGLTIKEATASTVTLKITGNEGAEISSNVKAVYDNITFSVDDYTQIDSTGVAYVTATCDITGVTGNLNAGLINKFLTTYEGLISVTNEDASTGGYDDEDTETYRTRLLEYLASNASNANADEYKVWAKSVNGVANAVIQSAETMGAGNVGVYISSIDGTVTDTLKEAVKDYIESVQPINATVVVNGLTAKAINVTATCSISEGYTTDDIETEFTTVLKKYLYSVEETVSYIKVADLLLNCAGVEDVSVLQLNGGTTSITIASTESAEVGNVVISE